MTEDPADRSASTSESPFENVLTWNCGRRDSAGTVVITDTTALEDKIDRMVYELYGLTEEEIGIVEGKEKF